MIRKMAWHGKAPGTSSDATAESFFSASGILSPATGYIRYVDFKALIAVAQNANLCFHLERRVGQFVTEGSRLLVADAMYPCNKRLNRRIQAAFEIGAQRTLDQDIAFGILEIVDIALRALSPAVNDPTTGICCIDQLSAILIASLRIPAPREQFHDASGVVRLVVPWLGFEALLDLAYDQIHYYGRTDSAINLRLLRAYGEIAQATNDPALKETILRKADKLIDESRGNLPENIIRMLKERQVVFFQP